MKLKKILRNHKSFYCILVTGLLLRILLNSAVDSFDFYAFVMWAKYLTTHRIADVFEFLPDGYTPYPPLYYYVLKFLGHAISLLGFWNNKWLTYFFIRLPVFAADILILVFIYNFTITYLTRKDAYWASAFYFLHPAIIYNTSIWGQVDSIVTVLGLLSILLYINKRAFWGLGIFIAGIITKLQILALLPLIVLLSLASFKFKKLIESLSIWLILATLPFMPIVLTKGIKWTWNYFFTIPNWYAYTSVYTYNLWATFGFIVSDNTKLFGLIEIKYIGIFLFWLVAFLIIKPLFNKTIHKPLIIMFAAFLLWYDFSFFATRIHSRYLIYSFGFFAPFFKKFPKLGILLSILMTANLLLPLKQPRLLPLVSFLNSQTVIFAFVIFALMVFILSYKKYYELIHEQVY